MARKFSDLSHSLVLVPDRNQLKAIIGFQEEVIEVSNEQISDEPEEIKEVDKEFLKTCEGVNVVGY